MRQHIITIVVVVVCCLSALRVNAYRGDKDEESYESDESDEKRDKKRTTVPPITRIGCYQDSGNRQLGEHHWDLSGNSPEVCIAACRQAGFKYAGPENGNQCFCGDEVPTQKISNRRCNKRCNGDQAATCGGEWVLEVFDSNLDMRQNFARVGCFRDKGERQLGITYWDFPMNSPAVCIAACRQVGYKYAGAENGNQCFCGNRVPPERIADINCNSKCNGVERFCGGSWILEVFHTGL